MQSSWVSWIQGQVADQHTVGSSHGLVEYVNIGDERDTWLNHG